MAAEIAKVLAKPLPIAEFLAPGIETVGMPDPCAYPQLLSAKFTGAASK